MLGLCAASGASAQDGFVFPEAQAGTGAVPVVGKAPPATIDGRTGDTLLLEAAATSETGKERFAWFVDGVLRCKERRCRLVLDAGLAPGRHTVLLMIYNAHGSSSTEHALVVFPAGTTAPSERAVPMLDTRVKTEAAKAPDAETLSSGVFAWTKDGTALQQGSGRALLLGKVPRRLTWEGSVQVAPGGTTRMVVARVANLYLMGPAELSLSSGDRTRTLRIRQGDVRAQHVRTDVQERMVFETDEVSVDFAPGADGFVRRGADGGTVCTRLISVSGRMRVRWADKAPIDLPPGLELTACADGSVQPLARPEPKVLRTFIERTFSIQDATRRAQPEEAPTEIGPVVEKANGLALEGDYFEVINLLSPLEERAKEDARIPFLLGMAYKGLYDNERAAKYFSQAQAASPEFVDAPWQLALLYLDEKRWSDAAQALDTAYDRMASDDPRAKEYDYYSAVAAYNLKENFLALDRFARIVMWGQDVDDALRSSASSFMARMTQDKYWSFVVPAGIQYDGNALRLQRGAVLPDEYPRASLVRLLGGLSVTREFREDAAPGRWTHGMASNLLYAWHTPRAFSEFDMVSLGLGGFHKLSSQPDPKQPPRELRVSEDLAVMVLNGHMQSVSLAGSALFAGLEAGASYTYDLRGRSLNDGSRNDSLELRQKWSWAGAPLGGRLVPGFDVTVTETADFPAEGDLGWAAQLTLQPALQRPFAGGRGLARVALGMTGEKGLSDNSWLLGTNPQLSVSWFVAPWLMAQTTSGVELARERQETVGNVVKPSASLMLSGLF